ncbi:hypothetical protein IQ07DRAFT_400532 [Pyrenochaeta sp. DS3sAY3a]|nr:hypothetical protein IQ07DRAFT_400532 [Pyrenochaeta sp. DS3sAY3a]
MSNEQATVPRLPAVGPLFLVGLGICHTIIQVTPLQTANSDSPSLESKPRPLPAQSRCIDHCLSWHSSDVPLHPPAEAGHLGTSKWRERDLPDGSAVEATERRRHAAESKNASIALIPLVLSACSPTLCVLNLSHCCIFRTRHTALSLLWKARAGRRTFV